MIIPVSKGISFLCCFIFITFFHHISSYVSISFPLFSSLQPHVNRKLPVLSFHGKQFISNIYNRIFHTRNHPSPSYQNTNSFRHENLLIDTTSTPALTNDDSVPEPIIHRIDNEYGKVTMNVTINGLATLMALDKMQLLYAEFHHANATPINICEELISKYGEEVFVQIGSAVLKKDICAQCRKVPVDLCGTFDVVDFHVSEFKPGKQHKITVECDLFPNITYYDDELGTYTEKGYRSAHIKYPVEQESIEFDKIVNALVAKEVRNATDNVKECHALMNEQFSYRDASIKFLYLCHVYRSYFPFTPMTLNAKSPVVKQIIAGDELGIKGFEENLREDAHFNIRFQYVSKLFDQIYQKSKFSHWPAQSINNLCQRRFPSQIMNAKRLGVLEDLRIMKSLECYETFKSMALSELEIEAKRNLILIDIARKENLIVKPNDVVELKDEVIRDEDDDRETLFMKKQTAKYLLDHVLAVKKGEQ